MSPQTVEQNAKSFLHLVIPIPQARRLHEAGFDTTQPQCQLSVLVKTISGEMK